MEAKDGWRESGLRWRQNGGKMENGQPRDIVILLVLILMCNKWIEERDDQK